MKKCKLCGFEHRVGSFDKDEWMESAKKLKKTWAEEAKKYLSGKQIIQVATYFKRYNEGKVTCVSTPEEIAKEFGYEVPTETVQEQSEPEIDINEINYPEEE